MRPRGGAIGTEGWLATGLGLLAVVGLLYLGAHRPSLERLWGDEPTYLAMAVSLAWDADLVFDGADLERARRLWPPGPDGLILQRTGHGITFSKPILYAIVAAPFVRLFGQNGAIVVNVLALAMGLGLGLAYLFRIGDRGRAMVTLVTFAASGCLLPYVLWRMSEVLEVGLILAGLVLGVAWTRAPEGDETWLDRRTSAFISGVALGLAATMRYPNAAIAMAPIAVALIRRRTDRAALSMAGVIVAFAATTAVTFALTGAANPYKTVRSGFGPEVGYPVGDTAEVGLRRFDQEPATSLVGILPLDLADSAYATLYFLVGRHTGLVFYLPAALILGATVLVRGDAVGRTVLAAGSVVAIFYLLWMPENYFGGGTFIGNRYLLAVYPAALVGLATLPGRVALVTVWGVAALAFGSAALSVARTAEVDRTSQSHANAGLFRLLPYESTARNLDGNRDRYWDGDFVRFVDPFAEVFEDHFRLTGSTPAELMIASHPGRERFRFSIVSVPAGATLHVRDWRGEQVMPVPADGIVDVRPAPAWRRHRFWFYVEVDYRVHTMQVSVRDEAGRSVAADLRFVTSARHGRAGSRPAAAR